MHQEDLEGRLTRMETRLARIETHLALPDEPEVEAAPPPPMRDARKAEALARLATPEPPPPPPPPLAPAAPPVLPEVAPPPPSPVATPVAAPPAAAPVKQRAPLELLLGGKLLAWVGAAAVVIGVGFFVHLAAQRGWWSLLSEPLRCWLGAAFGLALIGAGEIVLRRIGRVASVGLYAAGLASVYLSAWVAFGPFQLIGEGAAFLLMGVIAIGGFALTVHTRFRTIGVLSIVGGYLAPLLAGALRGPVIPLLGYLTMLLVIALGLSAVRARSFRVLRYVVLPAQSIVALVWLVVNAGSDWVASVIFMTLWWVLLIGESTLAALRRQSTVGNVITTLFGTALYVGAATWLMAEVMPPGAFNWLGPFTAAIGLVSAAIAFQFGPGIDGLRSMTPGAMNRLAVALWLQGGALLAVAVALQFDGFGQSLGWIAVGLAAIEAGRRLPSIGARVFGLVVGALGVARIALIDWWAVRSLRALVIDTNGIEVTQWGLLAVIGIAATQVAALRLGTPAPRIERFRPWRTMATLLATVGLAGWAVVTSIELDGLVATTAWLVAPIALLATWRLVRTLPWLELAALALLATGARWMLADVLARRAMPGWDAAAVLPVFNAPVALGGAIALVFAWTVRELLRSTPRDDAPRPLAPMAAQVILVAGIGFLLLIAGVEVDRTIVAAHARAGAEAIWTLAQQRCLWYAILAASGAAAVTWIGQRRRLPALLSAGCTTVVVAAFLWLTLGTIADRVRNGTADALPLLNLQFAAGVVIAVALLLAARFMKRLAAADAPSLPWLVGFTRLAPALVGLLGLWAGSLEIDRIFNGTADAVQAGLSIYWSIFAVGLIVLGFARRINVSRYAGLALLGITMTKVLFVDMSQVDQAWRVASFIVSGMVFIGASVLYGKLAPRLLE